ncbi:hypothetical protein J3R82DRAFT_6300 [Butyriboletus roseoflavus]|nr:hypothetical protein J3R82DRAFT_6300 [Butyriboletus roseoflavus]
MRVKTVLCLYYYSAMQISTFDIDEVQSDDPSLLGDDCVDLPLDALPDLTGDDLWWTVVPPSVSLKESMPHPSLLEPPAQHEQLPMPMLPDDVGTAPSTRNDIRSQYEPKMKWKVRDLSHAPASHRAPIPSGSKDTRIEVVTTSTSKTTNQVFNHQGIRDIRTAGITGASTATPAPAGSPDLSPVRNPKRSERAGKEDVPVRPLKKKKQFKSTEFTNEEDDAQARAIHAISLKRNGEAEALKVSRAPLHCIRFLTLFQPPEMRNVHAPCVPCKKFGAQFQTCSSFALHKEKRAESRSSPPQDKLDGLIQQVTQMSECIVDLEKKQASHYQEKERLLTSVALLELQVGGLKKKDRS